MTYPSLLFSELLFAQPNLCSFRGRPHSSDSASQCFAEQYCSTQYLYRAVTDICQDILQSEQTWGSVPVSRKCTRGTWQVHCKRGTREGRPLCLATHEQRWALDATEESVPHAWRLAACHMPQLRLKQAGLLLWEAATTACDVHTPFSGRLDWLKQRMAAIQA